MNDLSGYKNNILYITNDTKLSKIVGNSSYNSNKVKNTIYKKIYSNNFLNISKEKQTNSEYSNKIFSSKSNIKILTTQVINVYQGKTLCILRHLHPKKK